MEENKMKTVADWYVVREAENKGLVVAMTPIVERKRTELNNELGRYFRDQYPDYNGTYDEDACEDILYSLNSYIEENNIDMYPLDFPISEGTDIHLLKVNDNISLKVVIADEYYGSGSYSKYIDISNFLINENATKSDVDHLIDFVKEYLR
jgi:hypothetical protein